MGVRKIGTRTGLLAVLTTMLLTACAESGGDETATASLPEVPTDLPGTRLEINEVEGGAAAFDAYEQCVRDAGYPDYGRGGDGLTTLKDGTRWSPRSELGVVITEGSRSPAVVEFMTDTARCEQESGLAAIVASIEGQETAMTPERVEATNRYTLELNGCLRSEGWEFGDPQTLDNGVVTYASVAETVEERAAYLADIEACQVELYGAPGVPEFARG